MKPPRISPAGFPHKECQEDFVEDRAIHTASLLVETNPLDEGNIETLKNRVEAIEGSEVPVTEFADETAGVPKEGFNGF